MNLASKLQKTKHRLVEVIAEKSFWKLQEKIKLFGIIPIWRTIEMTKYYATYNHWIEKYNLKETYYQYTPPY